jgi:hypothetical protein
LTTEGFDLQFLIHETIERFWKCWVEEQTENSPINNAPEMLKKVIESAALSPLAKLDHANVQSGMPVSRLSASPLHAKLDSQMAIAHETNEGSDLSFEYNEKVARRIFFDVRQDGLKGTMSFLASTCVRSVFSVAFETNGDNPPRVLIPTTLSLSFTIQNKSTILFLYKLLSAFDLDRREYC